MTIQVIYRVLKTNGELAGEYMDKKLADAHDQKLDCIYTIADLITTAAPELKGEAADSIAEHLVDNKTELMGALKKVKSAAPAESSLDGADQSNVETLESAKQAANG